MGQQVINSTIQNEFHILAFLHFENIQKLLFIGILLMYTMTVLGNLVIITIVCHVPQLQTPMYFFLCNLSTQDILYVTAILPKLLAITITGDTGISYQGCIAQIFLFTFCICTEFFLLTAMAYDRYVAVCMPLHYSLIMNRKVCFILALTAWLTSIFNSVMLSLIMSTLLFCGSRDINHFFCDVKTMLKLSCSDTTTMSNIIFSEGAFFGFSPFVLIMTSYIYIISIILKIRTSAGRLKTFSSCSSHLTIVIIFYGTALSIYMAPESEQYQEQDKVLSLVYIAMVPMLNPLVYSLRNKQVLQAIKKVSKKSL